MSINASLVPSPPYTASVYFNFATFINRDEKGDLQHAPHLIETMKVLAGNGVVSDLFDEKTVEFFKEFNAITTVMSDEPIEDFLCLFEPKQGKALYAPKGGIFLQSKPDLRFAVEDTVEGVRAAEKAGRQVIGVYGTSPHGMMRRTMQEVTDHTTHKIEYIPKMLVQHIERNYPALIERRYRKGVDLGNLNIPGLTT